MSSNRQASIETLYPALLLEIVEYLSPTWIVNLWLTGSVQLRTSLSKRGVVTSLKLHGPNGAFSTSRLPGMIACFESLLHLSITSVNRIAVPYRIWNCLSQLVQLKTLQLEFPEVDEWMFLNNSSESEFATLYNESRLDYHVKMQLYHTMRPIATTFIQLETFKLSCVSKVGFIRNEHLSFLPKSLTSLAVLTKPGIISEKCLEYVASLPKLAMFHFTAKRCSKLSTPSLPPSITSLTIDTTSGCFLIDPSFWIGSNITDLNLPLDPASVADLPPTIAKLWVVGNNLSDLSFQHLPSLLSVSLVSEGETNGFDMPTFSSPLESLEMQCREPVVCNPFDLKTVFPTVKSLRISAVIKDIDINNAFKYIQCFTTLATLRLQTINYAPGHLHQLPPTLTLFEWSNLKAAEHLFSIDEEAAKLPRGLKILDFQSYSVKLSSSAFQHLPPFLKSLRLAIEIPTEPSDEEIAKHFQSLPRSLRSLNICPYVF